MRKNKNEIRASLPGDSMAFVNLPPPPPLKESKQAFELVNIKASLKYQNGEVFMQEYETNRMPALLNVKLLQAITKTIEDFYKDKT